MKKELWKEIVGSNGAYEISNFGSVRSYFRRDRNLKSFVDKSRSPSIRKAYKDKKGYIGLVLIFDGKKIKKDIHRLVAQHFLSKPSNKNMTVSHLDGNPSNNKQCNLSWMTMKKNHALKIIHGTHYDGETHYNCRLSDSNIHVIRKMKSEGISTREIAKIFGIHQMYIYKIVNGTARKRA